MDALIKQIKELEERELASLAWLYMKETGLGAGEIEMVRKMGAEEVSFSFRPISCPKCNPCVCPSED